ncbi:hypothetical protein [Shewanella sp. SR44-3]|uniref:hypothetical protein n=1 Tax=Shewanella sp. SR44-3 TaxID=2760936 RepID=UPI0015FB5E3E|nr:hypothetical protein [Shewanella sp. SR44-3]MBB1268459.1 hypothetical protein [Shewanella sp. SR44-3]
MISSVSYSRLMQYFKGQTEQLKLKSKVITTKFTNVFEGFIGFKAFFVDLVAKLVAVKMAFFALSLAQKLYLVAFIVLCATNEKLFLVAFISVIAMSLEFWPLFERVWHSLAGKAVLLLFYAIIANFALATSGAVVNEVVGVSASHLDYTHNFAILLYLPAWFVVMSGIVLLAMQFIIPLYFFISVLLKPFGVVAMRFTDHSKFRKTTALLRLILASIVLYHLGLLVNIEDSTLVVDNSSNSAEQTVNRVVPTIELQIGGQDDAVIDESAEDLEINPHELSAKDAEDEDLEQQQYTKIRTQYQQAVREMIALFAFRLEADSRSRCEKASNSNVIELNDYEILEVSRDESAPYGYLFEVKKCISPAFPKN